MAILPDRTELTTPADGDLYVSTDVSDTTDAATGTDKKITWSNIKAALKTYFDSLTTTLTNKTIDADNNTISNLVIGAEVSATSTSDINLGGNNIDDGGVIFLNEQAEADADVAGSGQIWVDTQTPNKLFFTDDAGTDFDLQAPEGTAVKSTGEAGGTKFLREDGDGTCSWQTPGGGGNVSNTGTPVDNQLAVWTAATTVEGDANLTWNGSLLTATGGLTATGAVTLGAGSLIYPAADGNAGEFMQTDGAGNLTFSSVSAGSADSLTNTVYNTTGGTLTKGSAVYISGFNVGQSLPEVTDADANAAATMPAYGIISADITNNSSGEVIVSGELTGIDTSSFSVGDALFVSGTPGELTATKPTTAVADQVQKVAIVTRSHVSLGVIEIFGAGRSNDVPNSHRTRYAQIICFDFTTDTATGDGKGYFHVPFDLGGMNLVEVHAEVITAGTTGTTDIQIANVTQAADMLTTKITIDSAETGSDTAATAAVIDTANDDVAENDLIRIDVDAVSTTAAKGLIVTLGFQLP